MRRTIIATIVIFGSVSWADEPSSTYENGVRASYIGSPELPDEIAYAEFLKLADSTFGDAESLDLHLQIVADALGIRMERESIGRVRSRSAFFRKSLQTMKKEQLASKISILCSDARESRSTDQVHKAMNAVDDVASAVRAKQYIIALNSLTPAEQEAFLTYLNDLKSGISYVKVDSRSADIAGQQDIHSVAEQSCNKFSVDYQVLGGVQQ